MYEFVSFELSVAIQPGTLQLVLALLRELPSDRDRAQMLAIVFDEAAAFFVTCAMLVELLDTFTFPASKRDAYEVLRGCVVDIHNAIAVEEHMHGVFQHLEEPLSHSKEADFEHRLASL